MSGSPPPLSIGMPVYNGERYVAAALGSLQDQTFADFELIICDNASTDATEEICRAFALADSRIVYYRNPENVGGAANFNRVFELARGRYFKWAAHDDVCAPQFLQVCLDVLTQELDTVLCHTLSQVIDARGKVIGVYDQEVDAVAERPAQRLWPMISRPHYCIPLYGIMRSEVLRRTPLHGAYVGADRNLLAELSLFGRIRLVPEYLFQRRQHPEASISRFTNEQQRLSWFDPAQADRISFPTWRRWYEYRASIERAGLRVGERMACQLLLLRWLIARHHGGLVNGVLLGREALSALRSSLYGISRIRRGART